MTDFQSILNKKPGEISRPKPLPVGTYLGVISGRPKFDKSPAKKTDFVDFPIRPLSAREDVDATALAEYGEFKELTGRAGLRFYITEDSVYRLDDFLRDTLSIADGALSERIMQAQGQQLYFTVRHVPSEDGKQFYAEIAGTARV